MAITYAAILGAVKTTMATVSGIARVEAYNNLQEGLPDLPLIRIYPQKGAVLGAETAQNTFGKGVQTTNLSLKMQVFVRQRSQLGEDHKAQLDMLDAISTKLESLTAPYFGVSGIKGLGWSWDFVTFTQGEGQSVTRYPGLDFTLELKIF